MRALATHASTPALTLPDVGAPMSLAIIAVVGVLILAIGLLALMANRR